MVSRMCTHVLTQKHAPCRTVPTRGAELQVHTPAHRLPTFHVHLALQPSGMDGLGTDACLTRDSAN